MLKLRGLQTSDLPLIGKVYDGGALPTTVDKYYLVHPVVLGGKEVEGGAGSLTVDTSKSLAFFVIGDKNPAAGDNLIGRFHETRWVAERFGGTSSVPQPGCPCTSMPSVLNFSGSYTDDAGPPPTVPHGWNPTANGCPTTTTLGVMTRPAAYSFFTSTSGNVIWQSPTFTFTRWDFNPLTGFFDVAHTSSSCAIVFACSSVGGSSGNINVQIWDVGTNPYTAMNATLALSPNTSGYITITRTCSPFLWKDSASVPSWHGLSQFNA
jgi:hypothetical protein